MTNPTPAWWQRAVFYQIYPRSFMDSNGDGVGDLQGILERLDYLAELGVDALWISPIYPSPMADFGYDVSDYTGIDPLFGDLETFDRLLAAAHARGLKIVLDYVPNHTSDEHPWFIEARAARDNPRRDWYIWRDAKPDGSPPNNWESEFAGSAWEWEPNTQQYYLHLFLEKQPDLNWRNPQVRAAMMDVLRFWLDRGVDGFRMDVVTYLMKHPDMPDNPVITAPDGRQITQQRYSINQPEVHERLREIRQVFEQYPGERVTIGETWFMDPHELASYYGEKLDELHLPFNFILLRQPWDARAMRQAIESYYAALPPGATPNFVLGNHDTYRLASRYGVQNHRSAGLLLLTLQGVPTLYYGDELGMENVPVPPERWQDPVMWRKTNVTEGRDPERAPMPWQSGPNAGFSPPGVQPWLPLPEAYASLCVAAQSADPGSTLNFYQRLLRLRRELPALAEGGFAWLEGLPEDVFGYLRQAGEQRLLVLIAFGDQAKTLELSALGAQANTLLASYPAAPAAFDLSRLSLPAHSGLLLELRR